MIFVYGSNEAGIHGAGAAAYAMHNHGAVFGKGCGRRRNSYGIPTKDMMIRTLPIKMVSRYVKQFLIYARNHPDEVFMVTAIGCGLAGFTHAEIAPLFAKAPENCWFDTLWQPILGDSKKYWGTFENGGYKYAQDFEVKLT